MYHRLDAIVISDNLSYERSCHYLVPLAVGGHTVHLNGR